MIRAALVALLLVAALVAAGCQAQLEVAATLDREGRGALDLRLSLDREAQASLGFGEDAEPAEIAGRFAPLLVEGGWGSGGDGPITATRDEATGAVLLETRHPVDSPRQLAALLSQPRPIRGLSPDDASLAALPDLPDEAALLNEVSLRLGAGTGDNPGFDVFARGGVGDIGDATCRGDELAGFGRSLRDAVAITYRLSLPGGPGSTNANETPGGDNVWNSRYGDCPALQATSGGGGSSTLVNGLILAGLGGILLAVFALRSLRGRGSGRPSRKERRAARRRAS